MKVIQINSVCGVGSTGRIAIDIHNMLSKEGHKSWIAYGRGKAVNCDNTIRIGSDLDVYGHIALTRLLDKHGFGSRRATIKLIDKIKLINPDIIHLHNLHGYYISIELLFQYLRESKINVVWTLHDCWSFTGHCAHYENIECFKWKEKCSKCISYKKYPKSIFIDGSKDNFNAKKRIFSGLNNLVIVTPSVWLNNQVKCSFLGKYSSKVINNGVDIDVFRNAKGNFRFKFHLINEVLYLGVASFWTKNKGYDDLIRLSALLKENERIVLVGLNEKQMSCLPKNIIGIKKTSNANELAEIYSECNVFLNPTYSDTFPTTNIEAMACGLPVVSYGTGGCTEMIDENNGIVVRKGDYTDLLCKARKVHLNHANYIDLSMKSHNLYNKHKCYSDYIKLYGDLFYD